MPSRRLALALATVIAVGSAVVMPDYRMDIAVFIKPFLLPILIALPLAFVTFNFQRLQLFLAASICAGLILVHVALSVLLYWLREGDALFDGLSVPIFEGTAIIQMVVSALTFAAVWVFHRARRTKYGG
jgi:hypothetical protein